MTPKNVVEAYLGAVAKADFQKVAEYVVDDAVWHQPGNSFLSGDYKGKDALFAHVGNFAAISNGTFAIDSMEYLAENGDLVAAAVHFVAKVGDKELSMKGVDLFRVENGKIAEFWLFSEDSAKEDAFWDALKK